MSEVKSKVPGVVDEVKAAVGMVLFEIAAE